MTQRVGGVPKLLGDGVKFDDKPLKASDLVDIVDLCNADKRFRKSFGGSLRIDTAGHLICELRQAIWGSWRRQRRVAFFDEMRLAYNHTKRPTKAETQEKRKYCDMLLEGLAVRCCAECVE